jgi:hypothetical protein
VVTLARTGLTHDGVSQEPSTSNEGSSEGDGLDISDDRLPEDLQPTEDNPLAQPADDDVPDDLLTQGGGHTDSGGNSEDAPDRGADDASDTSSQAGASPETEAEGARAPVSEPEDSAGG